MFLKLSVNAIAKIDFMSVEGDITRAKLNGLNIFLCETQLFNIQYIIRNTNWIYNEMLVTP